MTKEKDPKRQLQGAISKAKGKRFEAALDAAFAHYDVIGFAAIEKTPEPMRPLKSMGSGKFLAFFEKKAQPDYKGTLKGGKSVMFEAKFTSADRMAQSRVIAEQADCLSRHQGLGAHCFVIAGFDSGHVYRIPWLVWSQMKERFGRKYVTEADLEVYRVPAARGGVPLILE